MKHVFLTLPIGHKTGLTSVSIGLVRTFDRLGVKVSYYKPFSQSHASNQEDPGPHYIRAVTKHSPPAPLPPETWSEAIERNNFDEILEGVIETTNQILEDHDVLILEGLIAHAELSKVREINALLARTLNAETILVIGQSEHNHYELKKILEREVKSLDQPHKHQLPAVIINRYALDSATAALSPKEIYLHANESLRSPHYHVIGVVPENASLLAMRMNDFQDSIQAEIVHHGDFANRRIIDYRLCARQVENLLHVFTHGALIVTPADRSDIITAAALAVTKGVRLAGIVLTGDTSINQKLYEFCVPAFSLDGGLPVLRVNESSFSATTAFLSLNTEVPVTDIDRINLVMDTVARGIDSQWLQQRCNETRQSRLSPVAFKYRLTQLARKAAKHILLPEGEEPRTIAAAVECSRRKIAICSLLGDPISITDKIQSLGGSVGHYLRIIDPNATREHYITPLVERRKHKGITAATASDLLQDPIMQATLMVALGEADGLVSGAINSTAHTIRPALSLIKTAPNATIVSSIFFMCLPDQVLIYGDCAVNPNPDAQQLADIAIQSAHSAIAFGIEPRVAMISYSTLGSGTGEDVDKVMEATRLVKQRMPELSIDGPLQYDAASNRSVAATKAPDSPVAGNANVFIFPDLNTGNTTYKAVQRSAQVASIGPMLQGLNRPVNDLSRGTSVEDIIYTIALTAIQATQ
ncbi:phosphate acetyltransferase [Rubritalea marina]|uniref:phosphate acetyltransferase n=1 Tax=Rubritalea marina TaxID=361055 RepID=UPI0003737947|nr:phosphate acetyltransferase [Rubritalea marina]